MVFSFDQQDDGGTEGEVLEMEGGLQKKGAEGKPQEDKSGSEWGQKVKWL